MSFGLFLFFVNLSRSGIYSIVQNDIDMKETTKDTTTKAKKATTTKAKTTRTKKEEVEPVFNSLKEELAWLKAKKNREPWMDMRIAFLEQPIKVYTDYASIRAAKKEAAKKATKKKAKKLVKYENGEYVPAPKTFTQLKSYINTYCRAMGWKDKKFKFEQCKNLGFKDLKITGDKEKQEVYLTGSLVFQTPRQMFTKAFSKTFTIENHRQIRELIRNTYRTVIRDWKDRTEVDGDEMRRKNWCCVYDQQ